MGKVQIPGDYSGRMYDVTIEGDQPTAEEAARAGAMIRQREEDFKAQFEAEFGPQDVGDGTAVGRGLDRGTTSAYGALGTAARSAGEAFDAGWLERLGAGMEGSAYAEQMREAANMPAPTSFREAQGIGGILTATGEAVGQTIPEMGATMLGGIAGAGAGALAGGPLGAGAGFIAGSTAAGTPLFYGRNIQRQEEQVRKGALDGVDRLSAFLTAGGQAVLNSIADRFLAGGFVRPGQKFLTRTATGFAEGATSEVPTEITQQVLERWQAGLPLDDDEAMAEYIEAGVAAGVIGGSVRGGTAMFGPGPGAVQEEADAAPEPATPTAPPKPALPPSQEPTAAELALDAYLEKQAQPLPEGPAGFVGPTGFVPMAHSQAGLAGLQAAVRPDWAAVNPEMVNAMLDDLKVAPQAPIRKRLARMSPDDPELNVSLDRYARTPGVKAETRAAIREYLDQIASEAPVGPEPETTPEPTGEPTVEPVAAPAPAEVEPQTDGGGVPTDLPDVGGAEPEVPAADTPAPAVPDTGGLGMLGGDVEPAAVPEGSAPAAVAPEAAPASPTVPEAAPASPTVPEATPTEAMQRNTAPGAAVPAPMAYPQPDIRPAQGRMAEAQAQAQREPIQRQLNKQAALEREVGELKALLKSRRKTAKTAQEQGVTPKALAQATRQRINRANAELNNIGNYLRSDTGMAQADAERAAGFDSQMAQAEQEVAREQLRGWYTENAPAEVQQYDAEVRGDDTAVERDPTTVEDKRKILSLLNRKPSSLKGAENAGARAAREYFSKTRDVQDAMDNLAFDASDPDVPKIRRSQKDAKLEPYWRGTGRTNALRAAEWIEQNLSPEALDWMDTRIAGYLDTKGQVLGDALDKEIMTRRAREEAEAAGLETYYDYREVSAEELDTAFDFGEVGVEFGDAIKNSPARRIMYSLTAPLHPMAARAAERGNLRGALRILADTTPDPRTRQLAAKLVRYVGDTNIMVIGDESPYVAALRWGGDQSIPLAQASRGAYALFSPEELAEADGTLDFEAVNNTIMLNRDTGLNAYTLLHEMIHAATARELERPTSPVRARLETLRAQVSERFPDEYGVQDVHEFVAEAMSNQEFQQILSQVFPNEKKVSALTQFKRVIRNFVRVILGQQPKAYDDTDYTSSAFEEVDFLTDSILATAPQFSGSTPMFEDAVRPLAMQSRLADTAGRIKDVTVIDRQKIDAVMKNAYLPVAAKSFINDAFIPMRNLTEYASKYFDNADAAYQLITEHNAQVKWTNETGRVTIGHIADFFKANPDKVDTFNKMRTLASLFEVDPRKSRDHYSKYTLSYYDMDQNGMPTERKFELFDTEAERKARIADLNTAQSPTRGRARAVNDPDQDTLQVYDYLRDMYNQLGPQGHGEYNRVLGLFEHLHKEAARVFQARLEAMLPGQRKLQESIYKQLFDKLFSEQLLVAYQPLQREGKHWLYYEVKDPVTGSVTPFKESFKSTVERSNYVAQLRAQPEEAGVNADSIREYLKVDAQFFDPERPSPRFVADVGALIDKTAKDAAKEARDAVINAGGSEVDAEAEYTTVLQRETERAAAIQQGVVELALNMMPERSFLQTYKKREGARGFLGDVTVLDRELGANDTLDMLLRKNSSIARQLADMEFGAKAGAIRNQMAEEFATKAQTMSPQDQATAAAYMGSISRGLENIYVQRHPLVKMLNTTSFAMTLGFNLSSPVMNVMAMPTIVYPYLASKYGAIQTAKALVRATKVLGSSGTDREVEIVTETGELGNEVAQLSFLDHTLENYAFDDYDAQKGYNSGANEKAKYSFLQKEAHDRGLFVDSIAYDTLDVEGLTGHGLWLKFNKASGFMMHQTEKLVRESTLIATYDLELQRIAKERGTDVLTPGDMRRAAKAAAYETELTNGTVPAAGAPNLSQRGIMPMIYMFKRYPLAIFNLLATTMRRGFPSKAELAAKYGSGTPAYENAVQARKIARLQFASIVGSTGLWAGVAGMPLYGALATMADLLFKDEDEPNFDTLVRIATGELGFKGIGNYLFGVEMSSRIGLANVFYREPLRAEDQPPLWNLIEGAGGPAISLMHGWSTRSRDLWSQGEYYRAVESAAPSAVRNVLRALRFGNTGGAETLRDDIIADMGPFSVMGQLMGFAPAHYIRQMEVNTQLKRIDNAILSEKRTLLRRVNLSRRTGNRSEMQDAISDIRDFNKRHPQQAITNDTISRSRKSFETTTGKTLHGVIYNEKNLPMLRRLAADIESDTTIWDTLGLK